jgi:hypothetical protein
MSHLRLEDARRQLGLSIMELWIDYFTLGGILNATQLDRYLSGDGEIGNADRDVLVHALNEVFHDRGQDHPLAYRSL